MFETVGERIALTAMATILAIVWVITNPLQPRNYTVNVGYGVMPAKSAKEFSEGVCVDVHWYYGGTPYTASPAALKTALLDLHITCLRDQWSPGNGVTSIARLNDLAASGIKH